MSNSTPSPALATDSIRTVLLSFRDDINSACPPSTFASYFVPSSPDAALPCCIEHGPSDQAELPFLGRPFTGQVGILKYYQLISEVLKGKGGTYDEEDLLIKLKPDEEGKKARALWTGEAMWSVVKTGKEWKEAVVWAFDLEEVVEGEWRIEKWEVWADTLSAYLASKE